MKASSLISLILLFSSISVYAEGIKLNFKLDERYLICHTIKKDLYPRDKIKNIIKLQQDVKKNFPELYQRLAKTDGYVLNPVGLRTLEWVDPMVSYVLAHPLYPEILYQTKKHLTEVKDEWERNYDVSYSHIKKLTRLKFDKTLEVFITHPDVYQGRYNSVSNTIGWGRTPEWPNYATVYLWHETLHSYLESNQKTHALIELLTDDDLRCFLNKCSYPPFTEYGHEYLKPVKQWLYDKYWTPYLEHPKMDVLELENIFMNDLTLPTEDG